MDGPVDTDFSDLVDKSLRDFTIQIMFEVYSTDMEGRYVKSVGHFKQERIAKAFIQTLTNPTYHGTGKALVLTDGKIGITLGGKITILSDEDAMLEIRKKALSRLTPEERSILGH